MKKISVLLTVMIFCSLFAFSQNADKKWAVGFGPGGYYNLESEGMGVLGEFYLSRYLNSSFDLMLTPNFGVDGLNENALDFVNPFLNLRFKLNRSENAKMIPYIFAGPGYMWDNSTEGVNFDAGLGVKAPLSDVTSLYLQLAYIHGIDGDRHVNNVYTDVHDNLIKLNGIVEFALGSAKDTDMDGVSDKKDKCPGTPAGVEVDKFGCPVDRDGDGVADYKDECPDVAGSVSLKGCPDKDGDGVADKDDKCPDVAGLVKFDGCPDTDGDGVIDSKDKCPNTKKGCAVDADGCALDSDGDGVIDCDDQCPSEAGVASNNGCPPKQEWVTIEIPTVYFNFDRYFIRKKHKAELDKLAEQLDSSKGYKIVVGGHTDNIGTKAYNMKLSEKRAQEVVKYLLMKGVDNAYVGANYYGEEKPAVPNTSSANRQLNRRVEFEEAKIKK